MKPRRIETFVLGAALAALPLAAPAYMCRDAKGTTSYQEEPCPERKGTSGVVPVAAKELNDRGTQETIKRLAKAYNARDVAAVLGLYSRNLKVTVRRDGKDRSYDFPKWETALKNAFDGSQSSVGYRCKPTATPTPDRKALACEVSSEGMVGGRGFRAQDKDTFEFVLEGEEVKIASIDSTGVSRSEGGRY